MPHVATSPSDLLEASRRWPTSTATAWSSTTKLPSATAASVTLPWTAAFQLDDTTGRAVACLEATGLAPGRPASRTVRRGRGEVSGFTVPAINLRAQTFDMARTVFEAAIGSDVGTVIIELARSEQTYTYQPIDTRRRSRRGDRRTNWRAPCSSRATTTSSMRRSTRQTGGDDRGDPARLPPRHRRGLPQHRHRLLDAGRPVEADRRRAAARTSFARPS